MTIDEFKRVLHKIKGKPKTEIPKSLYEKIFNHFENAFNKIFDYSAIRQFDRVIDFSVRQEVSRFETDKIEGYGSNFVAEYGLQEKYIPQPKGLLLYGSTGTGKTTTARILAEIFDFHFIDVQEISRRYMGSTGNDWLNEFIENHKKKTIIIDDIGSESEMKRYGNSSPMIDIMAERAKSWEWYGTPTIYTTNLKSPDELGSPERYGERIKSRIGCCIGVLFDSIDHRTTKGTK